MIRMITSPSVAVGNTATGYAAAGFADQGSRRQYSVVAPGYVDVLPGDDQALVEQGWIRAGATGATAARPPASTVPGQTYIDTTLGHAIVSDGAGWRDPATGGAV